MKIIHNLRRAFWLVIGMSFSLTACAPQSTDASKVNAPSQALKTPQPEKTALPNFTASGSEPAWSMKWDGQALDVVIGIE